MITQQTRQKEIWKDIDDYKNTYQVSNKGNVRSLYYINNFYKTKHYRIKVLKQQTNKQGYKTIILSKNGRDKGYMVHG